MMGSSILNKVTGDISKRIASQAASSQLGGGAEVDGFNKTLTSLDVHIQPEAMLYVAIFMCLVLLVSLALGSWAILKKEPKDLLVDTK